MNEPTLKELPQFARRGQVRAWLGVSRETMTKLVRAGVLTAHEIENGGYAIYKREEVLAAVREGRLCQLRVKGTAEATGQKPEASRTKPRSFNHGLHG